MPMNVILHVMNAEPVLAEIDDLPAPGATFIKVSNPRRVDGKELHFLMENVLTVLWPLDKLNFIEVLPSAEEEQIIGFVRE
jgi:hypothetical protein